MRWIQLFSVISFLCPTWLRAEVIDKCPTFVSHWNSGQGSWELLSSQEAFIRLLIFSLVYLLAATLILYLSRKVKKTWIIRVLAAFAALIAIHLVVEFIPRDEPCSRYAWLGELPRSLYLVQLSFDAILLLVPLLLVFLMKKNSPNRL